MDELFSIYYELLKSTSTSFKRFLHDIIDWDSRLISITGSRGTGKTTLLLQHIKLFKIRKSSLYITADNIILSKISLFKLAGNFYRLGGKHLFIDEIHKYLNWSKEIQDIYDSYPGLKIVFAGNSIINLYSGFGDLSRRLISYNLPGLSFREYLLFNSNINIEAATLTDIINNRVDFDLDKPLMYFNSYLENGYYPFYKEGKFNYQLNSVINTVIETDIPKYLDLRISTIEKLKQLMQIIAEKSPFKPNITKIAEMLNISRNILPNYISFLNRSGLINVVSGQSKSVGKSGRVQMVYLNDTNQMKTLYRENYNIGNTQETFLVNQLSHGHYVKLSQQSDIIIDSKYIFVVECKNKKGEEIKNLSGYYLLKDDIEFGYDNVIPLWYLGMLY